MSDVIPDIRATLKLADHHVKAGEYPEAIALYNGLAEHYADAGCRVHAVAMFKQVLQLLGAFEPGLLYSYRIVWSRLADLYGAMGLAKDARYARRRYDALE